jgi:hypothetical protein
LKAHIKIILMACTASVLLSSCYYDVEDELYPGTSCDLSNVTYSGAVAPLMATDCAVPGCHVSGGTSPDLSTYAGVSANSTAVKQRAVTDKNMPPSGPLSSCDQQKLQAWIDAGAPNN